MGRWPRVWPFGLTPGTATAAGAAAGLVEHQRAVARREARDQRQGGLGRDDLRHVRDVAVAKMDAEARRGLERDGVDHGAAFPVEASWGGGRGVKPLA